MNLINMTESRQKSGKPFMSITKAGVIRFSCELTKRLGLKAGMQVAIFQDQDSPSDWYLKPDEPGLTLRVCTGGMLTNSSSVCKDILNSIGHQKGARMLVSTTPVDGFFAIITHSAN